MVKPTLITDLSLSIIGLERLRGIELPSTEKRVLRSALTNLRGIEALLITIDAFRPGVLRTLEVAAFEEMQVEHDDPIQAVTELVDRYCSKRERLR